MTRRKHHIPEPQGSDVLAAVLSAEVYTALHELTDPLSAEERSALKETLAREQLASRHDGAPPPEVQTG